MKEIKSFLGTGWSFPPSFNNKVHQLNMVSEGEDVKQSLMLILSTTPGERVTNPKFGCDLQTIMFQPMNSATEYLIRDTIKTAVLYYEPRIDLEEIKVDRSKQSDGQVNIELNYKLRQVNIRSNIVFPFYKVEGTSIAEV